MVARDGVVLLEQQFNRVSDIAGIAPVLVTIVAELAEPQSWKPWGCLGFVAPASHPASAISAYPLVVAQTGRPL